MPQDFNSLVSDLTCDDVIKCQKARRQLVDMGTDAIPTLIKALGNKRHWVRWEAAKALTQIGDDHATAALISALRDDEFDVRWLAAEGLIVLGRKALIPLLNALIENADSQEMRDGTHHILHDMNRNGIHRILRPVMKALESTDPALEVPAAAHQAVEELTEKLKS